MSQDLTPGHRPEPSAPTTRLALRVRVLTRRALGYGVVGGLYLWVGSPLAVASAAVIGVLDVLISHLRGLHRDITYRNTLSKLPATAAAGDFIIAMAVYEAIASGQMDPADAATVLNSAVTRTLKPNVDDPGPKRAQKPRETTADRKDNR